MKNILILGAGFGGLRAAKQIAKKLKRLDLAKKYGVVLIDKNEHHTYTPLLYEVATTSKTTANICGLHEIAAYNIKSLIARTRIKFIEAEIAGLNIEKGLVHLKDKKEISGDFIVLALGSEVNYFGIKGLKENSIPLKEFSDAIKIRDEVWGLAMENAGSPSTSSGNNRQRAAGEIKIVIGGGGSTGTELAGELKAWCGELETEFPKCGLDVKIIEAGPSVLAGFPAKIIKKVEGRLKKLNVEIIVGKRIVEGAKKEVVLDDGQKIPFDVLVWAGGVKAPVLLTGMPFKFERKGRVVVDSGMNLIRDRESSSCLLEVGRGTTSATSNGTRSTTVSNGMNACISEDAHLHIKPKIYGVGDSMCFYNPLTGKPIPGVARAAILQASVAAHNLIEEIKQSETKTYKLKPKTYKPIDYPYIIPVGGKWAVVKIWPFIISGFFGWVLKGLVELNYLLSIMPFWRAVKIWFRGLKIFIQNDRLG